MRGVSIGLACRAFGISQRCYRYAPVLSDENEEIEDWLIALTKASKKWVFGLCYLYLRNIQGFKWNHKRVRRIYGSVAKFDVRFAYCLDRGIDFAKSCRRGTLHAPCNNALVWPKLWIVSHFRGQNLGLRRTKFFKKKLHDRTVRDI